MKLTNADVPSNQFWYEIPPDNRKRKLVLWLDEDPLADFGEWHAIVYYEDGEWLKLCGSDCDCNKEN